MVADNDSFRDMAHALHAPFLRISDVRVKRSKSAESTSL